MKVNSNFESGDLVFRNTSGDKVMNIPSVGGGRVVEKIALTAGNANAFAFAWQNPNSQKILVEKVVIDITTAGGTAGALLDVGKVANGTSTASDIHNDLDLNSAVATECTGKAIKVDEKDGTNDFITGKILVQNAANLVGYAYIYYHLI